MSNQAMLLIVKEDNKLFTHRSYFLHTIYIIVIYIISMVSNKPTL